MDREKDIGWYRDPEDTRAHRYWDGTAWHAWQEDRTDEARSPRPEP